MILFQNKLLKLVKLAIKLTNKLIFVIGKIEKTYQDAEAKVENLSMKKLDLSNIPNYKYIDSLYRDLYFDPSNEYSVPYSFGMVGVIYNTKMVECVF